MNLYSPSAYKKILTDRTNSPASNYGNKKPAAQRKRRSSAMDMLFSAHNEAKTERVVEADAAMARNLQHNQHKKAQQLQEARRQQEEQNAQYAQKVQLEEHDSALAEHLHALESKRLKKEEMQRSEDEKLSMDIARKLQAEEDRDAARAAKEFKKIAAKDAKIARKVHKQNVQEIKREKNEKKRQEQLRLDQEKKSEQMARQLHAQEERQLSRQAKQKRKRAAKDEKIARKFHQKELGFVKRAETEEQRKIVSQKKEQEKMERLNMKSQAIAQRLQAEEHAEFMKDCQRRQQQHEEDERLARQMQGDELGDLATKSTSVRDAWSNPEVEVEETKSGAVITVQLPNVRRMEVDLDEDENAIFVNAIPKSADRVAEKLTTDDAHDELKKIVESQFVGSLKPVSFEIQLGDIVDGIVTADDIISEYRAETGLLRLELCGVVAKSKTEQKEFKAGLLSRLGSLFKPSFYRRGSTKNKKK